MRPEQPPIRERGSAIRSRLRSINDTLTNVMDDDEVSEIKDHLKEIATYDLGTWLVFKSATPETEERLRNNPNNQQVIADALQYGDFEHYSIYDNMVRLEFSRAPKAQYGDGRRLGSDHETDDAGNAGDTGDQEESGAGVDSQ